MEAALRGPKNLAHEDGLALRLKIMGVLTSGTSQPEEATAERRADALGIKAVDMLEGLGQNQRLEDMRIVKSDDIHLGEDGHRIDTDLLTGDVGKFMEAACVSSPVDESAAGGRDQ